MAGKSYLCDKITDYYFYPTNNFYPDIVKWKPNLNANKAVAIKLNFIFGSSQYI